MFFKFVNLSRNTQMINLEDQYITDDQVKAAYQNTRLEHNIQLDINSSPKLARLTRIMVTLGEQTFVSFLVF